LLREGMARGSDVVNCLLSKNITGAYYWLQVLVHEGGTQLVGWFGLNLQRLLWHLIFGNISIFGGLGRIKAYLNGGLTKQRSESMSLN
jgi:hypothetical protein